MMYYNTCPLYSWQTSSIACLYERLRPPSVRRCEGDSKTGKDSKKLVPEVEHPSKPSCELLLIVLMNMTVMIHLIP